MSELRPAVLLATILGIVPLIVFHLLLVLPFVLYGAAAAPDAAVLGGTFNPKDRFPFEVPLLGVALSVLGSVAYVAAIPVSILASIAAGANAWLGRWLWAGLAAALAVSTLVWMLGPAARRLGTWWTD